MDLIELGSVLGNFFEDGAGPSHDELDQAVQRVGLFAGWPSHLAGRPIGKTKRVRRVLAYAQDHDTAAGLQLAKHIVSLLRANGAFITSCDAYAGEDKIIAAQRAFASLGYDLDPTGALRPLVIDNLHGTELTEALRSYINRLNLNPDDTTLQIGTGKELDEAAARHVLEELQDGYRPADNFGMTLSGAYTLLGLEIPPTPQPHANPHREVQRCLFLLAIAVNRLRNDAGTGHGRPGPPRNTSPLTPAEARLVARSTALIAGYLLDRLQA